VEPKILEEPGQAKRCSVIRTAPCEALSRVRRGGAPSQGLAPLHVQLPEALERLERVGRCVWIAPPYITLQLLPGLDVGKLRVSQRVVDERAVHNITKRQSSSQKVGERMLRHAPLPYCWLEEVIIVIVIAIVVVVVVVVVAALPDGIAEIDVVFVG
jgi:hypothetical protein